MIAPHQRGPSQIVHRTEKVRSPNATTARSTKAAVASAPFDPVSLVMISPDEVCGDLARLSPPGAHHPGCVLGFNRILQRGVWYGSRGPQPAHGRSGLKVAPRPPFFTRNSNSLSPLLLPETA